MSGAIFMIEKIIMYLSLMFSLTAQVGLFVYHDKSTDLWGLKDIQGNVMIAPQFTFIYATADQELFSPKNKETEFLVGVLKNGSVQRITRDGKSKFTSAFFDNGPDYYEEGLARFIYNGKVGFHDVKGNEVIAPAYGFASPFRDGLAHVCNGCHAEYPQKPTYVPLSAAICQGPREPMYLSIVGGKWGMIDATGKIVVPLVYASFEEMQQKTSVKNVKPKAF
jgi:hypothetical protein